MEIKKQTLRVSEKVKRRIVKIPLNRRTHLEDLHSVRLRLTINPQSLRQWVICIELEKQVMKQNNVRK